MDRVQQDITQQGEKLADNETGGKFDSEVQDAGNMVDDAGNMVDKEADQKLPNL